MAIHDDTDALIYEGATHSNYHLILSEIGWLQNDVDHKWRDNKIIINLHILLKISSFSLSIFSDLL